MYTIMSRESDTINQCILSELERMGGMPESSIAAVTYDNVPDKLVLQSGGTRWALLSAAAVVKLSLTYL
jgi:hypothetical protein